MSGGERGADAGLRQGQPCRRDAHGAASYHRHGPSGWGAHSARSRPAASSPARASRSPARWGCAGRAHARRQGRGPIGHHPVVCRRGRRLRPPRSGPAQASTQTRPAACPAPAAPGPCAASHEAMRCAGVSALCSETMACGAGSRWAKRAVKRASSCGVRLISGTSTSTWRPAANAAFGGAQIDLGLAAACHAKTAGVDLGLRDAAGHRGHRPRVAGRAEVGAEQAQAPLQLHLPPGRRWTARSLAGLGARRLRRRAS